VAAVAINNDLEVLSADRDFAAIAEHSALRLTKV
jgi:predicted nucleic acid-binding protein